MTTPERIVHSHWCQHCGKPILVTCLLEQPRPDVFEAFDCPYLICGGINTVTDLPGPIVHVGTPDQPYSSKTGKPQ